MRSHPGKQRAVKENKNSISKSGLDKGSNQLGLHQAGCRRSIHSAEKVKLWVSSLDSGDVIQGKQVTLTIATRVLYASFCTEYRVLGSY